MLIKKIVKSILFSRLGSKLIGAEIFFNFFFKNDTVIFLYHETAFKPSKFHEKYNLNIPPDIFEKQIKIIKKNFNVINPEMLKEGNYKTPAALITFDDGAKGNFDYAFPIMEKLNCPSLMFLNMAPINGEIFWSGLITYLCDYDEKFKEQVISKKKIKTPYFLYLKPNEIEEYLSENPSKIYRKAREYYGEFLNANDLNKMSKSKLVSFGNHMYQHYNCALCSKEELTDNFIKNQTEIERFENSTKLFSYPFGQKDTCYDNRTNEIISNLGAEGIFAAHPENFFYNGNVYFRFPISKKFINSNFLRAKLLIRKIIIFFRSFFKFYEL